MSALRIDTSQGVAWMDGELRSLAGASLHFLSHGLANASCVFEGLRVYDGRVFRRRAHCERLLESAAIVGMAVRWSLSEVVAAIEAVVAAQRIGDGYVRPVVWRGHEALGISGRGARVHLAVAALPVGDPYAEVRAAGVRVALSRWRRPASDVAPVRAKAAASYLVGGLALAEAQAAGFDDALMLGPSGGLAEATGANLFVVRAGRLVTPPPDCFLDGVTRREVIALAGARGLAVDVRRIDPCELGECDEAFLTGTAAEVLPIRAIDGRALPAARPIGDALVAAYRERVRRAGE
jgi:branched-chain amino acid aminotransferase